MEGYDPNIIEEFCGWTKVVCESIRRARKDPEAFVNLLVRDNMGKPLRNSAIHVLMWRFFRHCIKNRKRQMIIEVPRGHGKTTQFGTALPAWWMGAYPHTRLLLVSNSAPQASKKADIIKALITQKEYGLIFPDVSPDEDRWSQDYFRIRYRGKAAGAIESFGIGSKLTGSRSDFILLDDPVGRESIDSVAEREAVIRTINADVMKTRARVGIVLWLGTPWHGFDAMQQAIQTGAFQHLRIALGEQDGAGRYTHYDVHINGEYRGKIGLFWGSEEYEQRRKESNDLADFERAYHLRILTKGTQTFPSFDRAIRFLGNRSLSGEIERGKIFVGCDPSSKVRKGTVVVVGSVGRDGVVRVFEVYQLANPADIPELFLDIQRRLAPELFAVERDAQQDALIDQWGKDTGLDIVGINTGTRKFDPVLGLAGLEAMFRRQQWQFLVPFESEDSVPSDSAWARLIREFRNHLYEARNREDAVMACYMLYRAYLHFWEATEEDGVDARQEEWVADGVSRPPVSQIVKQARIRENVNWRYPAFAR